MFMGYGASALKVIEDKAASYQIGPNDIGKIFTVSAAATLTLPDVTGLPAGWYCRVYLVADEDVVVASHGSNDNIVVKNDAAADSITWGQTGEQIGAGAEFVWTGTKWLTFQMANEAVTIAVA